MKRFWRSSIARSLFGGFIFLIIPSLLISFVANYYSMVSARQVVAQSYENYMQMLARQLDDRLDRFRSLAQVLLTDPQINYINEYPMDDGERIQGYVKMLQQLQFLTYSNEFQGEITVYLKNKDRMMTSRLGVAHIDAGDSALRITSSDVLNGRWHVTEGKSGKQLTFVQNPSDAVGDTNTVVKVDVNTTSIQGFLFNLNVPGGGAGFLMDGSGSVIQGGNPYGITAQEINDGYPADHKEWVISHNGRKFEVLAAESPTAGMKLVMYFPQDLMAKNVFNIRNWLIVATVLSVALALLFSLLTYRNLLIPIQRLIGGMRRVSEGDLKTRITEDRTEDLGFMFHQFNNMTERIDLLVNEVYLERIKNQQAQLDFLQSQINPHFLYNCLYTAYHLINSDEKEAAARMTLYLGDYFRYTTRLKREKVYVREEMAMIETYIAIQQYRYPEKIQYQSDLPDSVLDAVIPRLIIQPVVENAVIHGLEKTDRRGSITVTGSAEQGVLRIVVEDDGKGMADEEYEKLQQCLRSEDDNGPGYGLINTHRRIRLAYGPESGLSVERREPSGFRVTITVQGKAEDNGV